VADFGLDYQLPAADLSPSVSVLYRWHSAAPAFRDIERADHAQWRFLLSRGRAGYRFHNGAAIVAPAIHVVGAVPGGLGIWAEGPVTVFGMGLTPAGRHTLVGGDASAPEQRLIDVESAKTAAALAALDRAGDFAAMVAIAEALLRAVLMPGAPGAGLRFAAEVDAWLAASPSPDLADLIARTGVSRRQVERRCNALYGMSPKLLARQHRALRAAVAIAARCSSADRLIADGFYDQSHLIRELKRFTGWTPREVRERPNALAQLTVAHRRAVAL
jgi:AraC-like DNA-binding protein